MSTAHNRSILQRFTSFSAPAAGLALVLLSGSGIRAADAAGPRCTTHSPTHRMALVELYSSEGCDSCPPADRWLGQWKSAGAAHGIVPLALHVDYWNSLGWTDRFSQHRFTERQQTLTRLAGAHTIYTPEVFVAGRELRDWSQRDRFQRRIDELGAEPAQASVALALSPHAPGAFDVDAQFSSMAAASAGPLSAYLAVYENALTSQVGAGENRGATLHHERVVRAWFGPVPLVAGHARILQDIDVPGAPDDAQAAPTPHAAAAADRFGVVAFVESDASGEVLQAADLPACR
ncbi:DUF1223 domain-containing protein [Paraburkholderia sprentiae WSM5005]|uniref:DUF1223 domain-containing protein n=1 Tax=Paraburkholderia sprentiae WSM5005 TaxID=754502 RepID=A0A1I9YDL5_9BURK|nr:DUF1223 domain-containing protein [Paraburkholderia sprentiae]APA84398.1 DUF1223 domain-containing protein [Paraburkholderia sprentiae WSM5005]